MHAIRSYFPKEVKPMSALTQRATILLAACASMIFMIVETAPKIRY